MSALPETIELETGPEPDASVIWMHGLGADGTDFMPIVPELNLPPRAIRFVFPHAPMQPVTINAGYVMRAWYDVVATDFGRREDEKGVRASRELIEGLLAREKERGVEAKNIVLAGFSQGGAMALFTGLRHPEPLAGIMALSCYLPVAASLPGEAHISNRVTPIFLTHGTEDDVIPIALGRRSRDYLASLGYASEWREYEMPHAVCGEEIEDIGVWLRRVLG